MKLSDLERIAERASRTREVLAALNKAQGVSIDALNADGRPVSYNDTVKVLDDPAFIESVKTYLLESQTKILNEALAQLAEHGIELDPIGADEEEGMEDAA
jgi:hypothetical protein